MYNDVKLSCVWTNTHDSFQVLAFAIVGYNTVCVYALMICSFSSLFPYVFSPCLHAICTLILEFIAINDSRRTRKVPTFLVLVQLTLFRVKGFYWWTRHCITSYVLIHPRIVLDWHFFDFLPFVSTIRFCHSHNVSGGYLHWLGYTFDDNQNGGSIATGAGNVQSQNWCMLALYGNQPAVIPRVPVHSEAVMVTGGTLFSFFVCHCITAFSALISC